ncbi:MAG: hypothetical protein IJ523_03560 [Succinivibrionaceae bacterium]|nr:hypothetical protein [Succinivibrionaceae bacterium]
MLNPYDNRLDYGDILKPDEGFALDFAVGTTYSLDLDALIGALMPLGLSEETDSMLMKNPVYMLETLRKTGDRVAVFCEGGQIHAPNKPTQLYVLLEKIVFTVKTQAVKAGSRYPSFHPKFWLIKYANSENNQFKYRLVVLSRNLTFDRSWDVAFYMDGVRSKKHEKNEPVCDFLRYLLLNLPKDKKNQNARQKREKIENLIEDLSYVAFEPNDNRFSDYEFIPTGITNSNGKPYDPSSTPLFDCDYAFHEILVMSPFLTGEQIAEFNNRNKESGSRIREPRYRLFTRKMSLDKLIRSDGTLMTPDFEIWTLKDDVVDGELNDKVADDNLTSDANISSADNPNETSDDAATDIRKHDLHAKIYMLRRDRDVHLYLGSLNASDNAIHGNVEFMICLKTTDSYISMKNLSESLFCGEPDNEKNNPFEKADLSKIVKSEEQDDSSQINQIIKAINRSSPTAVAIKETVGDLYAIKHRLRKY